MRFRNWPVFCLILAGTPVVWCSSSAVVRSGSGSCPEIRTSSADFEISPLGNVRARLLSSGNPATLDEPGPLGGTALTVDGRVLQNFQLDCAHARTGDASGKLGAAGKRITLTGNSAGAPALEETIAFEAYDDFPSVLLESVAFRNTGSVDIVLNTPIVERRRLNAAQGTPGVRPYEMWSFQGASEEWGKDDVVRLSAHFSRPNPIQQLTFSPRGAGGAGGGLPVVAFWTARVGEAIGQLDRTPFVLTM
ncbi:MAG: hypothetical protein JO319_00240, partial [Acidobacteriaceae bacterium]|nr:hypothetical protein [Acidobacteriaceae bacterium]